MGLSSKDLLDEDASLTWWPPVSGSTTLGGTYHVNTVTPTYIIGTTTTTTGSVVPAWTAEDIAKMLSAASPYGLSPIRLKLTGELLRKWAKHFLIAQGYDPQP